MVLCGAPGGAPGPRAVVIPSVLPYGGRKSGKDVRFVSKPALGVVITCELAARAFGRVRGAPGSGKEGEIGSGHPAWDFGSGNNGRIDRSSAWAWW